MFLNCMYMSISYVVVSYSRNVGNCLKGCILLFIGRKFG